MLLKSLKAARTFVHSRSMTTFGNRTFIETHELEDLIDKDTENLAIFNASYPTQTHQPKEEHIKSRIKGSIFYDFDKFSNPDAQFSFMVPTEKQFTDHMKCLNVTKDDLIVVYDKIGMISAPRAKWLFKTFGIPNVCILNGSFSKWQQENRPLDSGDHPTAWSKLRAIQPTLEDFKFKYNKDLMKDYEDILKVVSEQSAKILDSRFEANFKSGTVPTAKNIPFSEVLNSDKTFKKPDQLKDMFKKHGIEDPENQKIVVSCQRGITACIVGVALESLGNPNISIYDGSYEEFAARQKQK